MKNKEVPDKIISGGTDMLIIEYLKNSYSTYPFTYYQEIVLSDKEQDKNGRFYSSHFLAKG